MVSFEINDVRGRLSGPEMLNIFSQNYYADYKCIVERILRFSFLISKKISFQFSPVM